MFSFYCYSKEFHTWAQEQKNARNAEQQLNFSTPLYKAWVSCMKVQALLWVERWLLRLASGHRKQRTFLNARCAAIVSYMWSEERGDAFQIFSTIHWELLSLPYLVTCFG